MKIALIGYGKMGRAIDLLAQDHEMEVVARIASSKQVIDEETLSGAEVALEFTHPGSAVENIVRLAESGCDVVVGTTGWYDRLEEVSRLAQKHNVGICFAPNFALGVEVFQRLSEAAGELLGAYREFDFAISEVHHSEKRDSPSGTALALAERLQKVLEEREPGASRPEIASLRVGCEPGCHRVIIDSAYETITIEHRSRSRAVFAAGALKAARWITGKQGLYSLGDTLEGYDGDSRCVHRVGDSI